MLLYLGIISFGSALTSVVVMLPMIMLCLIQVWLSDAGQISTKHELNKFSLKLMRMSKIIRQTKPDENEAEIYNS